MYSVDVKYYASSFSVPSKIADEMLRLCSGEQLKVIICISRNPEICVADIAKKVGLSEEDVLECIEFWTDAGIIRTEEKSLPVQITEKDNKEIAEQSVTPKIIPLVKPTQQEINNALKKSRSLKNLFNEAQQILGDTFGYTMQCVLYNIVFYYGLSQDVANLLLNFAKYVDATSQQQLYSIAKSWAENGITDCVSANEYIDRATKARKLFRELAEKTENADVNPTFAQYDYLFKWMTWGFKSDVLIKAHGIMKEEKGTGTLNYRNFQYMDSHILKHWHEAGLCTLKEIESSPVREKSYGKQKLKPKKETSFDIELVKQKSRDTTRDFGTMKNKKRKRRV